MANYPPLSLNSKMPFGKHKGLLIKVLVERHPDYVDWLLANTDVKITFEEQEQEDELEKYLNKHPNPYGLNLFELRIAVLSAMNTITKRGEPGLNDWDDTQYVKPDHFSYYGSVY